MKCFIDSGPERMLYGKKTMATFQLGICLVRKVTVYNLLFSLPEHSSGNAVVVTPALVSASLSYFWNFWLKFFEHLYLHNPLVMSLVNRYFPWC